MLELLLWISIFLTSLFILTESASHFITSAERLGKKLRIPSYLLGVTVISLGTALPELTSSVAAVVRGSSELVTGIVIGSNVTNILLVLGISAIYAGKITISKTLSRADQTLLIGSTILLALALFDHTFQLFETLIFLGGFLLYIGYALHIERSSGFGVLPAEHEHHKIEGSLLLSLILLPICIYLGAFFTIESVTKLGSLIGKSGELIASTAIALGTSLPELVVSLTAIKAGKAEIALGNILGANIINAVGVLGIASLFGIIAVPTTIVSVGIPLLLAATFIYYAISREGIITPWEGGMLLLMYAFYVAELLFR